VVALSPVGQDREVVCIRRGGPRPAPRRRPTAYQSKTDSWPLYSLRDLAKTPTSMWSSVIGQAIQAWVLQEPFQRRTYLVLSDYITGGFVPPAEQSWAKRMLECSVWGTLSDRELDWLGTGFILE